MTERINLSAAEISFLLSTAPDGVREAAYTRLHIGAAEQGVEVRRAGLASLLLRGLVVADNERYQVAPAVAAVYEGLTSARVAVQVGFVTEDKADGTFLFDTGLIRFFLAPRAHSCFEIVGLDPDVALRTQLGNAVADFLRDHTPAVASIIVDTTWPPASDTAGQTFSVAVKDDSWIVGVGDAASTGLTRDDALRRLDQALAVTLPAPVAPASHPARS